MIIKLDYMGILANFQAIIKKWKPKLRYINNKYKYFHQSWIFQTRKQYCYQKAQINTVYSPGASYSHIELYNTPEITFTTSRKCLLD